MKKRIREIEKRSTLLLNRMIRTMISERLVEGAPMVGPENIIPITHPSQCPYPQLYDILPNTPASTLGRISQKPNLASHVLVLLELAGRSTMTSIVGMVAKTILKMMVLHGCQMRSHLLLMHGSVTSANHEQLQAGLVDKSCSTMNRTTRRKVCCPQV
jgi:hypothetical protein